MSINKNIKFKKIINVYQLNYTNSKSPGLGDFIRGCFCLMQISKLLKVDFDLDISNHPISNYINIDQNNNNIEYDKIEFYKDLNIKNKKDKLIDNFIKYLNDKNTEIIPLFSNAFPINNYQTDMGRNFIKSKFIPNQIMENYIQETLNELGLNKYDYSVIHIRTGDIYLNNNDLTPLNFIDKILKTIDNFKNLNTKYLILSDNNLLKKCFIDKPNFYVYIKNIEHLGGEHIKLINDEHIKDTLLDFYLMSYSNLNICLSVYNWRSGFSEWCSKLYNIPFNYIIL